MVDGESTDVYIGTGYVLYASFDYNADAGLASPVYFYVEIVVTDANENEVAVSDTDFTLSADSQNGTVSLSYTVPSNPSYGYVYTCTLYGWGPFDDEWQVLDSTTAGYMMFE